MLYSQQYGKVISSLGWVDKGGLWVYDNITDKAETITLSNANYIVLFAGCNGYFSVLHVFDNAIEITVHHFGDPTYILSKVAFNSFGVSLDKTLWENVPQYYVADFSVNNDFDTHLVKIGEENILLQGDKTEWYRKGNYDFMYQGLSSVTQYFDELIFTVQRDGSLYRFSLKENKLLQKIVLAGNHGNPVPHFGDRLIWTVDYDTLVQVSVKDWSVVKTKKLQDAEKGVAHFIGELSLNSDGSLCVVPRPFAGDVITLNENLKVKRRCILGKQPLQAVALDDQIIARDWKTGELLKGKLKKFFFF